MISWSDFFSEVLPTLMITPEFWEYLANYEFCDEGVRLLDAQEVG